VRASHPGFSPVEGTLDVAAGETATWAVTLSPTAETRAAFAERALTQRRWARGLMVGGGAVALAGGIATLFTWRAVNGARTDRDRVFHTFDPGGACYPYGLTYVPACKDALDTANDDVHHREVQRGLSLGVLAAGLVATAVGAALVYAGPDPAWYDRAPPAGLQRTGQAASGHLRARVFATPAVGKDQGRGFEAGLDLVF